MSTEQLLFIPVILGTAREGRRSEHAARFVFEELKKREGIETELIDVREHRLPATDDTGETETARNILPTLERADGFIVVSPEYNHGYPGELKMFLDMSDGQYAKKPIAICGVSEGAVGGARMMEQLRNVILDLGATPILAAVYFATVEKLFNEEGEIQDDSYRDRVSKMFDSLLWYTKVLKAGRERESE
ncbi:NAD(P)H-dependent oxidoreductase [Candidatus Kaiserbacteria bacterium]|nr:NAD(P)H-dependent oxidoreductase [Candidatus Kaiserbacteria bacterium]